MRQQLVRSLSLSFLCMLVLSLFALPAQATGENAFGQLKNAAGNVIGSVNLFQNTSGAVQVTVTFNGLPAGQHGIHFHSVGRCDPPTFASAGEHFNPGNRKHGLLNPGGPHAGDLPNLTVLAGGSGTYNTTSVTVTLSAGATQLIDADGAALVIHANADDNVTDPAGNSGTRIACAVLTLGASNIPAAPSSGAGGIPQSPDSGLWWLVGLVALLGGSISLMLKRRSSQR